MLHGLSSRNSRVPPPRLLGAGRGSPPSFGGSCCCPVSVSWSTRPAFSWLSRATSISPATFFLFACILPEAWTRFWRALGSFPKIERTGAEPPPLARSLLLIGSRARLSRRLRHGSGIGTRSRHTFGLRNSGRAVVSHRSRSVPHRAPRKPRSSPSVDDPKLRLDAGGSSPAQRVAVHAVRPRLALPAFLHHRLLAMLGAEFADRGMDGSQTQATVPVPELSIKGGSPLNLCAPW